MKKIILAQFIALLAGTIFAWVNFALELSAWLNNQSCASGCSLGVKNPFLTPCFYGAIFFTIAFVLSSIMLKKYSSRQ